MFLILCSIISCICLKWTFSKHADGSVIINNNVIVNFILIAIFIGGTLIQFDTGIHTYPTLAGNFAEIKVLENRIKDIRSSNYGYEKEGNFIAGSIENYKQSTNLTKYIADLATKESNYNKELKTAKIYKEMFLLYFFGSGWAISDKIYELDEIK